MVFCSIICQVFLSLLPEHVEMIFSYSISDPIKYHVYYSGYLIFSVPLTMPFYAVLSIATGVGGCGWPISSRAVCMNVSFWKFSNNPPNYVSVADAMTFLIMLYSTCTGLFTGALLVLLCWVLVLGKIFT